MNGFDRAILSATGGPLRGTDITVVQVNVGLRCNQACRHCHLECSPGRTEEMGRETMKAVRAAVLAAGCGLVDVTGGSPELNPHLRWFIDLLRGEGLAVQVRTNLTVLLEPGCRDLPRFFRERGVGLVASLPYYREEHVAAQRGEGVWRRSIEVLLALNDIGYGLDPGLPLTLIHNPGGPVIPADQRQLEEDYRRELLERHGVRFTRLHTITNMPMGRFRRHLADGNGLQEYLLLLERSFNPRTVAALMCRHQVSIGWDGTLYDCDFNQALGMPVDHGAPDRLERFSPGLLARRQIVTGRHCFACTAAAGSS